MRVEWATIQANPEDNGDCIGKDGGIMVEQFPPRGGVSDVFSPRQIVLGMKLDMLKHC